MEEGVATLLVREARDVDTALARFIADDTTAASRSNGPVIDGSTTITLADVGFGTIDFSGRRFRAGFNVTLARL